MSATMVRFAFILLCKALNLLYSTRQDTKRESSSVGHGHLWQRGLHAFYSRGSIRVRTFISLTKTIA